MFSEEAREAAWRMGGLLRLVSVSAISVVLVGFCAGGLFGIDRHGKVVWSDDTWGHVGSVEWKNLRLYVDGIVVDPETGSNAKE